MRSALAFQWLGGPNLQKFSKHKWNRPATLLRNLQAWPEVLNMAVVSSLEAADWSDILDVAWQETMQKKWMARRRIFTWLGQTFHREEVSNSTGDKIRLKSMIFNLRSELSIWHDGDIEIWCHRRNCRWDSVLLDSDEFGSKPKDSFRNDVWFEVCAQAIWSGLSPCREITHCREKTKRPGSPTSKF